MTCRRLNVPCEDEARCSVQNISHPGVLCKMQAQPATPCPSCAEKDGVIEELRGIICSAVKEMESADLPGIPMTAETWDKMVDLTIVCQAEATRRATVEGKKV